MIVWILGAPPKTVHFSKFSEILGHIIPIRAITAITSNINIFRKKKIILQLK